MQGLKNIIFFVEQQEVGHRLCSLHREGDKNKIEEVVTASGSNIAALEPNVENVKSDRDEVSLYFIDDKIRLHKARTVDGKWVHTIQDSHTQPKQPLQSWSRVGVSRQVISYGQETLNIKTGE